MHFRTPVKLFFGKIYVGQVPIRSEMHGIHNEEGESLGATLALSHIEADRFGVPDGI
jgi:hypothetical protein